MPPVFPEKRFDLVNLDDAVRRSSLHSPRGERAPPGTGDGTDESHRPAGTRPLFPTHPPRLRALVLAVSLLAAGGVRGQTSLLLRAGARLVNPAPVRTRPDDSRPSPDRLASSQVRGVAAGARRSQLIRRPGGIIINPDPAGQEDLDRAPEPVARSRSRGLQRRHSQRGVPTPTGTADNTNPMG